MFMFIGQLKKINSEVLLRIEMSASQTVCFVEPKDPPRLLR